MRIVIDLQSAQGGSRLRGIGRYALAMAQALVRKRGDHEVLIVLNGLFPASIEPVRASFVGLLPQANIRVWEAPGPASFLDARDHWRRKAGECLRTAFIASLCPDLVFVPSAFEDIGESAVITVGVGPSQPLTVITSHDLIPLMNEEIYLKPHPVVERFYRQQLAHFQRADAYLAISESSRREVIDWLGKAPAVVESTAEGVDGMFRPLGLSAAARQAVLARFGLTRQVLMYSGATDERKNHLRLIKAFSLLPPVFRASHQLVFVGGLPKEHREKFEQYAELCGLSGADLVVTGRVTDAEMVSLYNICDLFVFPSWHEGFGLPALEAMACGAPVLGSNTSSLPEVIGRDDALFDPFDAAAISAKIAGVLADPAFRAELAAHALVQARRFSWDRSAVKAIQAFEQWHAVHQPRAQALSSSAAACSWLVEQLAAIEPRSTDQADWVAAAQAIAANHPASADRQLLVDVSELVERDSRTGVQRVVRSVLAELLARPPAGLRVEPVYSAPGAIGYRYARRFVAQFLGRLTSAEEDSVIDAASGDIFFGLDLKHDVVVENAAWFQWLRNRGVRVHFLVHDLLPVLMPHVFRDGLAALHARWLSTLAQSDGVVCVSRTVADEMVEWLRVFGADRPRPLQIGWSHNGADIAGSLPTTGMPPEAAEVLGALSRRPTFLMVGTIEPRKGQMQTLLAFEKLWAEGLAVNLVLVGKVGWNVDLLVELLRCHSETGRRLFWLQGISDEYLGQVYGKASCLIFPSEGEGFGLPLIEAAQHRLPIIARDIPVFREVAGTHAHYFAGLEPAHLADAVQHWLALDNLGQAPQSERMPWLTWEQSTRNLLSVIVGEQWYRQWLPDGVHRFWGGDSRLSTAVGERAGRTITATGQAGHLVYGPYLSLPPGRYRVEVFGVAGRTGLGGATMDVAISKGSAIVLASALAEPDAQGRLLSESFLLRSACSDLEVRLLVSDQSAITVSMIEIAPWQPSWTQRLSAVDQRFGTKAGRREGTAMVSDRRAGHLLFGPYMALEAGSYDAVLCGLPGADSLAGAYADVVVDGGALVLGAAALSPPDEQGRLAVLSFSLDAACLDLEIRVWVTEQTVLSLSCIEIAHRQEAPLAPAADVHPQGGIDSLAEFAALPMQHAAITGSDAALST